MRPRRVVRYDRRQTRSRIQGNHRGSPRVTHEFEPAPMAVRQLYLFERQLDDSSAEKGLPGGAHDGLPSTA